MIVQGCRRIQWCFDGLPAVSTFDLMPFDPGGHLVILRCTRCDKQIFSTAPGIRKAKCVTALSAAASTND
jgi:hypothetical protein